MHENALVDVLLEPDRSTAVPILVMKNRLTALINFSF